MPTSTLLRLLLDYSAQTERMKEHLDTCGAYMESIQQGSAGRLSFQSLSPTAKRQLDQLAAMAVYGGARPLTMYADPAMKAFLRGFNAAYTPSDRHSLAARSYGLQNGHNLRSKAIHERPTRRWNPRILYKWQL